MLAGSDKAGKPGHAEWSSDTAFILAAIGAAVGLGNIWKFPYVAGENGGGAFVLIYLLCAVFIAIPLLIAELMLGRRGHENPVSAMQKLIAETRSSPAWKAIGWFGVIAAFLILTFYSVIAGWTIDYVILSMQGTFAGATGAAIERQFKDLLDDPWELTVYHTVFIGLAAFIVGRGIQGGVERAVTVLMPMLGGMLILLLGYSIANGAFAEALAFMFTPNWAELSFDSVLTAIGQAFFSISVGAGIMLAYGAYLPQRMSIPRAAVTIALSDTAIAMIAGLAIFPLVFQVPNLSPAEGPQLVFITLPNAFAQMTGGVWVGSLFFILLAFAALTSGIALLEPAVAWLGEQRGLSRATATWLSAAAAWVIGLLTVLSFNVLSGLYPLNFIPIFEGKTLFDILDILTSKILLPLGGALIALFAGWVLSPDAAREEFGPTGRRFYGLWRIMVRYIAPPAVLVVLFASLF